MFLVVMFAVEMYQGVITIIKKVLHNKKGASLIISIVILMVCVVLAGVILSAALVNLSKVERSRQEHQAYLTAESTALLFRDLFAQQEIAIKKAEDDSYLVTSNESGDFSTMLCRDIKEILDASDVNKLIERNFTMTDIDVIQDQEVKISYSMNRGYGVEIKISVLKQNKILTQMQQDISPTGKTQDGMTMIKWNNVNITRLTGG